MVLLTVLTVLTATVATGCSRGADVPRTIHTLDPSPTPTYTTTAKVPRGETACALLSAQERSELAGESMKFVVPDYPLAQRTHCQWAHSQADAAIQIISAEALDARDWALQSRPAIDNASRNPATAKAAAAQLKRVAHDLIKGKPSRTQACDIYWLLTSLGGVFKRGDQVVYPQYLGPGHLTRVISTSCVDGVYTAISYGKFRLYPTPTLGDRVVTARKAAEVRAIKRLGPTGEGSATPTATPTTKRRP